jgi:regulator of protease activity HflC (stomatin/prohibitin superfamily)
MWPLFFPILVLAVVLGVTLIREVKEYERGVKFTIGKFSKIVEPGWSIVIPVLQTMTKVDMRVLVVDVPTQEAITKDNISIAINAVVYFKVNDAAKSVIQVQNFFYATSQLAQTTMRNAVGEVTLDSLLSNRGGISLQIRDIVDKMTDGWGIQVVNVELKDVIIPENMKRTIAKEAESERERRAMVIKAKGEIEAAENVAKAAAILGGEPGALHLRTLQSINDISSDQSNTTVWMIPMEVLHAVEGLAKMAKK